MRIHSCFSVFGLKSLAETELGPGGWNPHDVKADATWQKCTAIDWTKVAGEPTMEGKLALPSIQTTGMGWDVHGLQILQQSVGDTVIWPNWDVLPCVANLVKLC